MTPVLQWIKSHLVVVICSVVILAAPITAYVISSGMIEETRNELRSAAGTLKDLDRYKSSTVSIEVPGGTTVSVSGVANPRLIAAYRDAVGRISGEAEKVHAAGLEHNRRFGNRDRTADDVLPGHFPAPGNVTQLDNMPYRMHEALLGVYATLLDEVGAGMPPDPAKIAETLERRRMVFVAGQRKDSVEDLDAEETSAMRQELADMRLSLYRSAVTGEDGQKPIRFYADESVLGLPPAPNGKMSLAAMFEWQWRYWIAQDVLHALAAANGDDDELKGPVKRLLSLQVQELGSGGGSGDDSRGGSGMGSGSMGMGMGTSGAGRAGMNMGGGFGDTSGGAVATDAASFTGTVDPAVVDPAAEARVDPTLSLTGRSSNSVYDVRTVRCRIVAATSGLPKVLDAVAAQNFMTIVNVRIEPADAFAAAAEGFIYGVEPVSIVTLDIETVWFREWTADMMPPDLRSTLGIQSAPQTASDAG